MSIKSAFLLIAVTAFAAAGCENRSSTESSGVDNKSALNATARNRPPINQDKAAQDLKMLALAYHNYLDSFQKPPQKPADLLPFVEGDQKLIKSVEDGDYVLLMNANFRAMPDGTSQTVLGYLGTVPAEGGPVLFADGTIQTLTKEEFAKKKKAGK